MLKTVAAAGAVVLLMSCGQDPKIAVLEREAERSRHELAVKQAEIEELKKTNAVLTTANKQANALAARAAEIALEQQDRQPEVAPASMIATAPPPRKVSGQDANPLPASAYSGGIVRPADSTPTRTRAAETPRANAPSEVSSFCSGEWPGDARMQDHCAKTQMEAKARIDARQNGDVPITAFNRVRRECFQEWGPDYRMRDFCEQRALRQ